MTVLKQELDTERRDLNYQFKEMEMTKTNLLQQSNAVNTLESQLNQSTLEFHTEREMKLNNDDVQIQVKEKELVQKQLEWKEKKKIYENNFQIETQTIKQKLIQDNELVLLQKKKDMDNEHRRTIATLKASIEKDRTEWKTEKREENLLNRKRIEKLEKQLEQEKKDFKKESSLSKQLLNEREQTVLARELLREQEWRSSIAKERESMQREVSKRRDLERLEKDKEKKEWQETKENEKEAIKKEKKEMNELAKKQKLEIARHESHSKMVLSKKQKEYQQEHTLALSQMTVKEKEATHIIETASLERDRLLSERKTVEEDLIQKEKIFTIKKTNMLNELKKQKEKWDKALKERALTLDTVKEELIARENSITMNETEVNANNEREHLQLQLEWNTLHEEQESFQEQYKQQQIENETKKKVRHSKRRERASRSTVVDISIPPFSFNSLRHLFHCLCHGLFYLKYSNKSFFNVINIF